MLKHVDSFEIKPKIDYLHGFLGEMAKKAKYYAVWKGRKTGVFSSWAETEEAVKGFEGAQYKSFDTEAEAEKAAKGNYWQSVQQGATGAKAVTKKNVGKPLANSISVDAACSGNPGILEYQGVETSTKRVLFSMGPFPEGTVNIGEFLAIVHGLSFLQKHNSDLPIYSDSKTALSWVRNKAIKTNLERNTKTEELFRLVDRALIWLKNNTYSNQVLKWETEFWGENPADYGRK
ncbi:ribonuclease H family protein [Flectobacillus sp. BAB-3569]|uniref:ribonuclease H family protein n=1 Tax=Flectobacillus sp. BAB-3569 TaxID=1509483 RepID=UPI0026C3FDCC|nr:ribonuclease H family protein [Flectobacillus sp. BAB-3569]